MSRTKTNPTRVSIDQLLLDLDNARLTGYREIANLHNEGANVTDPKVQKILADMLFTMCKNHIKVLLSQGFNPATKTIYVLESANGQYIVICGNRTVYSMQHLVAIYRATPGKFTQEERARIKEMLEIQVTVVSKKADAPEIWEHINTAMAWSEIGKTTILLKLRSEGHTDEEIMTILNFDKKKVKYYPIANAVYKQLVVDPIVGHLLHPEHFTKLAIVFKNAGALAWMGYDPSTQYVNIDCARAFILTLFPPCGKDGKVLLDENGKPYPPKGTQDNCHEGIGSMFRDGTWELYMADPTGRLNEYKEQSKAAKKAANAPTTEQKLKKIYADFLALNLDPLMMNREERDAFWDVHDAVRPVGRRLVDDTPAKKRERNAAKVTTGSKMDAAADTVEEKVRQMSNAASNGHATNGHATNGHGKN